MTPIWSGPFSCPLSNETLVWGGVFGHVFPDQKLKTSVSLEAVRPFWKFKGVRKTRFGLISLRKTREWCKNGPLGECALDNFVVASSNADGSLFAPLSSNSKVGEAKRRFSCTFKFSKWAESPLRNACFWGCVSFFSSAQPKNCHFDSLFTALSRRRRCKRTLSKHTTSILVRVLRVFRDTVFCDAFVVPWKTHFGSLCASLFWHRPANHILGRKSAQLFDRFLRCKLRATFSIVKNRVATLTFWTAGAALLIAFSKSIKNHREND